MAQNAAHKKTSSKTEEEKQQKTETEKFITPRFAYANKIITLIGVNGDPNRFDIIIGISDYDSAIIIILVCFVPLSTEFIWVLVPLRYFTQDTRGDWIWIETICDNN